MIKTSIHIFCVFVIGYVGAQIKEDVYYMDATNILFLGLGVTILYSCFMFMSKLMDAADNVIVTSNKTNIAMNILNDNIDNLGKVNRKGMGMANVLTYVQMFMPIITDMINNWHKPTPTPTPTPLPEFHFMNENRGRVNKPHNIEKKSPNVEKKSPNVEKKSPNVEKKSPNVDI